MFSTNTKETGVIGIQGLAEISKALKPSSLPVVAIGGISASNASEIIALSGCDGVAVVSAIFGPQDVQAATAGLRAAVDEGFARRMI